MKKIVQLLLLLGIINTSCNTSNKTESKVATAIPEKIEVSIYDKVENAVIYEANIRQYSPEGSFNSFTKDIPKLKELGVKVLWLMPIYPISTTKSKGSLGSYYAISNYTKVNSEFGTLEDFRNLVKVAHDNDILVILDWVANHTGWDHNWIKEHPEFYTKDAEGNITHSEGTDWTDVADLNYENPKLREEMTNAMLHWVKNENIDGFRCDVAGMVPTDFWNKATSKLREVKPLFMLAEAHEAELQKQAFDMGYSWDTHHIMNAIAKGEKKANELSLHLKKLDSIYDKDDIQMNFATNHDENSWNGSINERMGKASNAMISLTYILPGMPLIYSGQEYGMDKRLLFFEKDTIPKTKGPIWNLHKKLGALKNNNPTLNGGKNKSSYQVIKSTNDEAVFALNRTKNNKELLYIANFSNKKVVTKISKTGNYSDYFNQETLNITPKLEISLKPWEFRILLK